MIPTIITIWGYCWALFIYDDGSDGGWFSGSGNVFMLIPVSIISTLSWILYAILK